MKRASTRSRRRTRSPLSLWAVTATTLAAAAAVVVSASPAPAPALLQPSPPPPPTGPLARQYDNTTPDTGTTPAFPSGVLGLEAVGQELGHLGRHARLHDAAWSGLSAVGQPGDAEGGLLHWQQRRQAVEAISSTTAASSSIGSIPAPSSNGGAILTSQPAASSVTAAAASIASTRSVSASSAASGTATAPTSTSTSVPEGYTLPQPFDSTLGTNFSSTACPSFFATFLADPTFQSCAPFSLLLTTSTGFFQAERSPSVLLPYVLNASCSTPLETCANLMDSLAGKIKLQNTCAKDLALGNPLVAEALDGFDSYRLMRQAGCQKSNSTGNYCFADAAAKEDPSDLYFYYLPEGTTLPSGTSPDCDSCSQGLMSIYASYATNSTLPISRTYSSGRAAVALACGPTFAPVVTAVTTTSAAGVSRVRPPSSASHLILLGTAAGAAIIYIFLA
ncbi:hypothetical protein JCM10908_000521 [Rhodotorula pacifica]|uniref:uncharacterized protein n=1 Tax=Rhodotorula pacifica TaxID=1495444 RepID=UPI00316E1691